jgi:16S rRNA (adenine1518-N6/adenine1519-N6)-dimethyltransferase
MARQKLGQHFLGDASWQRRIFETLPKDAGDTWIEIGAGHGEMTRFLASQGGRVIAIETDQALVERLRSQSAQWGNVEIVPGDILETDLRKLTEGNFHVYGNLPYYITSPILHQLFDCAERLSSIHIVIQREVAERIVAQPGCRDYGYLSAACQFYARPEIAFEIPPGAFRPPPRVTSALVRMTLPGEGASLGISDQKRFLDFIQNCFAQKRKTLRNNLRSVASGERIHRTLAACGISPDARAEQLSLAKFAGLFAELQ